MHALRGEFHSPLDSAIAKVVQGFLSFCFLLFIACAANATGPAIASSSDVRYTDNLICATERLSGIVSSVQLECNVPDLNILWLRSSSVLSGYAT